LQEGAVRISFSDSPFNSMASIYALSSGCQILLLAASTKPINRSNVLFSPGSFMCTGAMDFRDGFRKAGLSIADIDFDVDERTVEPDNTCTALRLVQCRCRATADLGEHRGFSVVQGSLRARDNYKGIVSRGAESVKMASGRPARHRARLTETRLDRPRVVPTGATGDLSMTVRNSVAAALGFGQSVR
jgi:hypothetical protein